MTLLLDATREKFHSFRLSCILLFLPPHHYHRLPFPLAQRADLAQGQGGGDACGGRPHGAQQQPFPPTPDRQAAVFLVSDVVCCCGRVVYSIYL